MKDSDKPTGQTVVDLDEEAVVGPDYSVVIELTPEELAALVPETGASDREKDPRRRWER